MDDFTQGGGARVKATIDGVVKAIRFDELTGEKKILFGWTDPADGAAHEKWMKAADLEPIDAPAPTGQASA